MGEDGGRRPERFDLPNSPVAASLADLDGRVVVQRTSAGTQGVVRADAATRLFVSSLVCAPAPPRPPPGPGAPTYVITGRRHDVADRHGEDDQLTAELIERARTGVPLDAERTAAAIEASPEAARTLAVGEGHVHPDDIAYAVDVDRFDLAMEVERRDGGLCLRPVRSIPR